MTLILGALIITGCTTQSSRGADRIIERVEAPAPSLPPECTDGTHGASVLTPTEEEPNYTINLFSSDWCDACDRMLAELSANTTALEARGIRVRHVVTQTGGSCVLAARVGRRAPFPYHATTDASEARWAIRSTPTLWITRRGKTSIYVEGEVSIRELLELSSDERASPGTKPER